MFRHKHIAFIQNAPIPVELAGLRGTTYSMGSAGWDLSIQQGLSDEECSILIRIAGQHKQLNARCLSYPLYLHPRDLEDYRWYDKIRPVQLMGISQTINLHIMERDIYAIPFRPIDYRPMMTDLEACIKSFDDLCIFKPLNEDVEIVVPEYTIPELQKKILELQEPKQREIREKQRLEQSKQPGQIIPITRQNIKIQVVTNDRY